MVAAAIEKALVLTFVLMRVEFLTGYRIFDDILEIIRLDSEPNQISQKRSKVKEMVKPVSYPRSEMCTLLNCTISVTAIWSMLHWQ